MSDEKPRSPERKIRFFTQEEANALVPRLQMTLGRMLKRHAEILCRLKELSAESQEFLDQKIQSLIELARQDDSLTNGFREIEAGILEIESLGVVFQGMELGLVDFPSVRDGKVVFLCWQAGETAVHHWHETDAGFAGRQTLENSGARKLPVCFH